MFSKGAGFHRKVWCAGVAGGLAMISPVLYLLATFPENPAHPGRGLSDVDGFAFSVAALIGFACVAGVSFAYGVGFILRRRSLIRS